jgi:hypothetical protein
MRAAVIRSGPQTVLSMVFPMVALAYIVIDGLFSFRSRVNVSTTA